MSISPTPFRRTAEVQALNETVANLQDTLAGCWCGDLSALYTVHRTDEPCSAPDPLGTDTLGPRVEALRAALKLCPMDGPVPDAFDVIRYARYLETGGEA